MADGSDEVRRVREEDVDPTLLLKTEIRSEEKLATLLRLVARDGALCAHCGVEENLTIDHVDPKGGNRDANLQILCLSCNASKGSRTDDKIVRWANGVWAQGFTVIPNAVLLHGDLSPAAFRVYSLFLYFARQSDECWPGQEGLARQAGISERTIRDAIRELETAELLKTRRRGRGQTNIYVLLTPRLGTEKTRPEESADQERQDPPLHKKKNDPKEEGETTSPPRLVKIDGRDLGFDALAEACGVDVRNRRRVGELAGALKEIRGYAWEAYGSLFPLELGGHPEGGSLPEAFERYLAAEIGRRAALYRRRLSGATLTPSALAKWWHDVDGAGARRGPTADDFGDLADL